MQKKTHNLYLSVETESNFEVSLACLYKESVGNIEMISAGY